MVLSCCAPGCTNRATRETRERGIHFYRIPTDAERRRLWLVTINRKDFLPNTNTYICSVHFVGGEKNDDPRSPAYVHVPSIFGFSATVTTSTVMQQQRRYESVKRRQTQKDEMEAAQAHDCHSHGDQLDDESSNISAEIQNQSGFESHEECTCHYKALKQDESHQLLQVGKGFPDSSMLINDDKLNSFYSGLPSYTILMSVFTLVTRGISESAGKLTNFQCFLLTLMKLRLNLSNYDLGFRFCIHETTVSRCLVKWIQLMDTRLTPLIHWPDRDCLQKTMPWCFRLHYGLNVSSIIDCFELFIEKPSDLLSRAVTWSTYKHYNTIKYLISITPHGTVNFISKGYGGRASDKHITINCGYLENIRAGDIVLADRGFNVEDSIAYRGATLNIPAFTHGRSQLPPEDVERTRKIANVRIHVERVIGSVRQRYKILSATTPLPTEYTRSKNSGPILLDSIVHVCCALHNVCDIIIPT